MSTPADYPMFVNRDGLYGAANEILHFEHGDLTEQQWRNAEELDGYDRFMYIDAIVRGYHEEVAELEENYGLDS